MTIDQFKALNQIEKEEVLFNSAYFVANYHCDLLLFDVYKYEHFYIECCYELKKNESAEISAATSLEKLPCYDKWKDQRYTYN